MSANKRKHEALDATTPPRELGYSKIGMVDEAFIGRGVYRLYEYQENRDDFVVVHVGQIAEECGVEAAIIFSTPPSGR